MYIYMDMYICICICKCIYISLFLKNKKYDRMSNDLLLKPTDDGKIIISMVGCMLVVILGWVVVVVWID